METTLLLLPALAAVINSLALIAHLLSEDRHRRATLEILQEMQSEIQKLRIIEGTWQARDNKITELMWAIQDTPWITPEAEKQIREIINQHVVG